MKHVEIESGSTVIESRLVLYTNTSTLVGSRRWDACEVVHIVIPSSLRLTNATDIGGDTARSPYVGSVVSDAHLQI
jgi:hypothetical protein